MDTCGEQYRLKYVERAPQREMWAGVGGSAYHTCVEVFEKLIRSRDEGGQGYPPAEEEARWEALATAMADSYRAAFADDTAKRVIENPDYPPSEWYVNSKGEGRDWWLEHGPQMVYKYVMKQRGRDFTVLAIEAHAELDDVGGAPWQGYIDRVEYYPATRKLVITDDKTGRIPTDRQQLDAYAWWADRQDWGVPVTEVWSRWYNARTGEYAHPRLFEGQREADTLDHRYYTLNLLDNHKIYPARPSSSNCKPCPVRSSCSLSAWRELTTR